MTIYLIDYENTKNLTGINNLPADDCVAIFYSQKANSITFDVHQEIISSKATIEYKNVDVGGQNALDFQLSSYLGYIISKTENPECKIRIVSKDKGFSFVTAFWKKEKGIDIQILSDLTGGTQNSITESPKQCTDIQNMLEQSDIQLSADDIKEIVEMVNKYKTVQTVNGNLNKLFKDSTKAGAILKIVKPFIKK